MLHLCGSPTDQFNYDLSIIYASSFTVETGFNSYWALIDPQSKKWRFSRNQSDLANAPTLNSLEFAEMDLMDALHFITRTIKPVIVVNHLFCLQGSTNFR